MTFYGSFEACCVMVNFPGNNLGEISEKDKTFLCWVCATNNFFAEFPYRCFKVKLKVHSHEKV
jgi:hypothetical protein